MLAKKNATFTKKTIFRWWIALAKGIPADNELKSSSKNSYKNLNWLWISVPIFILDQWSKYLAMTHLIALKVVPLFPFLNLCLSFNQGAAFSFLHNASGWQRWFFISISIFICFAILKWVCRLPKREKLTLFGLALIFSGALGNLWDRWILGYVIDFIQLHVSHWYFPTFNIADSAISIGATLVVFGMFKKTPSS